MTLDSNVPMHDCRRALEALRNGVPNRFAVRMLGSNQEEVETRFRDILASAGDHQGGMLVSGDFGTGKSHILTHLDELALGENFVCSKIAVSKETPLYDLGKVFTAAVESASIPGRSGRLIEELASALDPGSSACEAFVDWTRREAEEGSLSLIFPATLAVYLGSQDTEMKSAIESFWGGDRILIAHLRSGLREIDELARYRFRAPRASELPAQRLRFLIELIRGAGFGGWTVLIDELELIGSYSILQRGRAYAELARWLGRGDAERYPGLAMVGTVTEDFGSAVISTDGKRDCDYVVPRLRDSSRHAALAPLARTGMECIQRECLTLSWPTDKDVAETVERLRAIYSRAYGWEAPRIEAGSGGAGFLGRMRYKVRMAINQWDILRLVPGAKPALEVEAFEQDYTEDPDRDADHDDATC